MGLSLAARRSTLPYAIFAFWLLAMFAAWTLPLLSRPAQGAPKASTSQERKEDVRAHGTKKPRRKEGFTPGSFPEAIDHALLTGSYKAADPVSLGPYSAAQASQNSPIFPAGSCGTNNLRYWRRPGNGTTAFAEFDGALYQATEQKYPPPPPPPRWDAGIRINFYDSCRHVGSG